MVARTSEVYYFDHVKDFGLSCFVGTRQVDQDRRRQDRPTAAEDAEADADEQGDGDDKGGQEVLLSSAITVRMSGRGPRLYGSLDSRTPMVQELLRAA